jgi:hypothetical protein
MAYSLRKADLTLKPDDREIVGDHTNDFARRLAQKTGKIPAGLYGFL